MACNNQNSSFFLREHNVLQFQAASYFHDTPCAAAFPYLRNSTLGLSALDPQFPIVKHRQAARSYGVFVILQRLHLALAYAQHRHRRQNAGAEIAQRMMHATHYTYYKQQSLFGIQIEREVELKVNA
eukprot:IDg13712t1